MQKSVRPLYRCCCCRYSGSHNSEPLFLAVYKNSLTELKSLISCGKSANVKSVRGNTLLNYVIEQKRIEIFNWLLSLEEIEIDCTDDWGRSPLLHVVANNGDAFFALELIKNGADINLRDHKGLNLLHLAARHATLDSLRIARDVVERGIDLNAINDNGETPLYVACRRANFNFAYMLLYYGADANIACDGVLPLMAVEQECQLQEILFSFCFEGGASVPLPTLVAAMTSDSNLFDRILNATSGVICEERYLKFLFDHLTLLEVGKFRVFVKKFGEVIEKLVKNQPILSMLDVLTGLDCPQLKELLYIFLESECVFDFVQTSNPSQPTLALLLRLFNEITEEEMREISCLMLSNGLSVISSDLDAVFSRFGYCPLFKILLHMDIKMADDRNVMAAMYYDPEPNLENFFIRNAFDVDLLRYFSNDSLKERCLRGFDGEKVKLLPTVPYLVELSRNEARRFIIEKYEIRNSCQFYTILKWLHIGEVYKRIIAFEKKLYWI